MISMGHRVRVARALLGVTRKQLADASGVSSNTIAVFETGHREISNKSKKLIITGVNKLGAVILINGARLSK